VAHDRFVYVIDKRIPGIALGKNAGADTGSAKVFFALKYLELDVYHSDI